MFFNEPKFQITVNSKKLKHKLYTIIFESDTRAGKLFDVFLIWFILFSIFIVILESIQSLSDKYGSLFKVTEYIITIVFTVEYIIRIYCSPKPKKYIFSFFGIIDLLSTLPIYLSFIFKGAHYFLVIRAFRLIRIFRIFRLFNFLNEGQILLLSLKESVRKIIVFFFFVVILVISIGTLMYILEGSQPKTQFDNIPNSIYWAVVTMTTVGYGDITPVTPFGKFLSAIVMLIGYTIIAVPTGIVSASMIKQYRIADRLECPHCRQIGHEPDAAYCRHCGNKLKDDSIINNNKTK